MRGAPIVVLAVVLLITAGASPGAGAAATIDVDGNSQQGACEENQNGVIALVPGEIFGPTATLKVHVGTVLRLELCGDEMNGEWSQELDGDGYEIDASDGSVEMTVTDPITSRIDFGEQVEAVEQGVTIRTPTKVVVDDNGSVLRDETELRLENSRAEIFENKIAEFNESRATFDERMGDLESSLAGLSDDPDVEEINRMDEQLENINKKYDALLDNASAMERILYDQAAAATVSDGERDAYRDIQREKETISDRVDTVANEYSENMTDIQDRQRSTIITNLFIGLLGGLVVGLIAGAIGPYRRGSKVSDFYQVNSRSEYSINVLQIPAILGLAALLVGLGLLVLFGIAGVIL